MRGCEGSDRSVGGHAKRAGGSDCNDGTRPRGPAGRRDGVSRGRGERAHACGRTALGNRVATQFVSWRPRVNIIQW